MEIINKESIEQARKEIEKARKQGRKAIVQGKSIEFNRLMLENRNVSMLILSHKDKKDRLKQRDSGLNQVLCKIAKDNNIIIAINLNELVEEQDKKQKGKILARILQNIKLMKKFRNNFKLINYNNKNSAFSFLLTLGMPTDMAKKAVEN